MTRQDPAGDRLLSVRHLTRRFGRLAAVDGLDLEVADNARHAVIGPNGAGKTTLLNLIAGTIRPTGGRISFAGRDVTATGPARRARSGIARTFQAPALADSLTGLDNVVLGAWRHSGARAGRVGPGRHRRLATRCLHLLDQLGIPEVAYRPAGTLAHGQRRLLEIGAALAARPRLLLLDEPAAGLTDADLPRLLSCLRQLSGQVTVMLVEHHMDVVSAVAETVTVLHHGQVLATGGPDQVIADPAVKDVYLGTRAELTRAI